MADTYTWFDADGNSTNLSDMVNALVLWGIKGDMAPTFNRHETVVPLQPGSLLDMIRVDNRTLSLPVLIRDTTPALLLARLRALVLALDSTRGDGRLRITRADTTARELVCRCADNGGLGDSGIGADQVNVNWLKTVLTFRATDPFWYTTMPTTASFTMGTPPSFFPFFPLNISSGALLADQNQTNPGDTDAWPIWTVNGPMTYVSIKNATTGKLLECTYTLLAGQSVTIDTRPGQKTVLTWLGSPIFSSLSTVTSLWSLKRGTNRVQISMQNATGSSSVNLSFYPRYLSA